MDFLSPDECDIFRVAKEYDRRSYSDSGTDRSPFVYALTTKDVMSSLILGTFSAYILWHKLGCVGGF